MIRGKSYRSKIASRGAPNGKRAGRAGNLADHVYTSLRRAIIEQALKPGTKLPEDSVGSSFGVSRTVVRSAIVRLIAEGLVVQQPNMRATVASPSLEEGRAVFRVRRGLERMVIEELAGRLEPTQLARLRAHVASEEEARRHAEPESIRLAGEFHVLLAEFAGGELLTRYVNEVVSRSSLILAVYGRPHSSECAVNEHRTLIDALEKGKTDVAIRIMDEHLVAVATRGLLETDVKRERSLQDILSAYRPAGEK
jgi:DNA-binding GntR family transcriptional regulator